MPSGASTSASADRELRTMPVNLVDEMAKPPALPSRTSYTSKGSRRPAASYFGMSTDVPSSGFTTGGGTGAGLAAATRAGIGATAIGTGGGGDVHAPRTSARPIGVSVWGRGSLIGALIAP